MHVLVVGAGIAGLTLARALVHAGHRVEVLERAPAFRPLGAGLVLQENALAVLDALGLGQAARRKSQRLRTGTIANAAGRRLLSLDTRMIDTRAFHRADLHDVLLEGATGARIHFGTTVAALEETAHNVKVRLEDGRRAEVDLVVGADGLHSSVRAVAFPDQDRLAYAGYTVWRLVCPNPGIAEPIEQWSHGRRVGMVPLTDNRLYAFLVSRAPRGTSDPLNAVRTLRKRFAAFGGPARKLLDSLHGGVPTLHHDVEVVAEPIWPRSRVCLIGDAAHATTPDLGQGAAQAIEDAGALALQLSVHGDVRAALQAWRDRRLQRVVQIHGASQRMGRIAQAEGFAADLRDLALRLVPRALSTAQLRRLVGPGRLLAAEMATSAQMLAALTGSRALVTGGPARLPGRRPRPEGGRQGAGA